MANDWVTRAKQLQDQAMQQGNDLQGQSQNEETGYNTRKSWGQGSADQLYSELNDTPGYTPGEAGQINVDYSKLQTPQSDLNNRYLTSDEQSGIAGNPYQAMDAYNPDALTGMASGANDQQQNALSGQEGKLDTGVGQTKTELDAAASNPDLQLNPDYAKIASTGLNQTQTGIANSLSGEAGNVRGAISSGLKNYQMTPQQQQDIVTGAGISAGTGYRASEDTLQRQAAAAGANPMGVAAYRARAERDAAGAAGDAMTQARIQASDAAAQREMNQTQLQTSTESDLGKQHVAGTEASGQMQQDVINKGEQLRLGSAQDIATRQAQAATTAGQLGQQATEYAGSSRLNTQAQNADRTLGTEAANQKTGQGLLAAGETAASGRANTLATNRQGTTADVQNTGYTQGMQATGATAAGAKAAADARIAGQTASRNYYTGQATQAQQGAETAAGQKIQAYGGQYNAANTADRNGITANAQPGTLQKIAGAVSGFIPGASGGGGGSSSGSSGGTAGGWEYPGGETGKVVTKPTTMTIGENGPEYVAPLGAKNYEDGGVATEPTVANVGENGPEAVVPVGGQQWNAVPDQPTDYTAGDQQPAAPPAPSPTPDAAPPDAPAPRTDTAPPSSSQPLINDTGAPAPTAQANPMDDAHLPMSSAAGRSVANVTGSPQAAQAGRQMNQYGRQQPQQQQQNNYRAPANYGRPQSGGYRPQPQQSPLQGAAAGGFYRDASGNLRGGQAPVNQPQQRPMSQGQYGRPSQPQYGGYNQPQQQRGNGFQSQPQNNYRAQPSGYGQPQYGGYRPQQQPQQSQWQPPRQQAPPGIQHQGQQQQSWNQQPQQSSYRAQPRQMNSPMAAGKIVTQPTTALIGENGPEAVIPLNGRTDANVRPSVAFGKETMRRPFVRGMGRNRMPMQNSYGR